MPDFEYDSGKGKFRSYLKTATLRAIFERRRQKHAEAGARDIEDETHAAETDPAIEDAWETEWRQYHLRQAMKTIEAEFRGTDRRAFHRYAIQGEDANETASSLGLSVDQIYQAKSRITKRLRQLIRLQVSEEG